MSTRSPCSQQRPCPDGMAELASSAPGHLVPVPNCEPARPSKDWRSCSYAGQKSTGDKPCIPLDMCAYLGGTPAASGAAEEGGGAALTCTLAEEHGAELKQHNGV
jgi:hypothetical protein